MSRFVSFVLAHNIVHIYVGYVEIIAKFRLMCLNHRLHLITKYKLPKMSRFVPNVNFSEAPEPWGQEERRP